MMWNVTVYSTEQSHYVMLVYVCIWVYHVHVLVVCEFTACTNFVSKIRVRDVRVVRIVLLFRDEPSFKIASIHYSCCTALTLSYLYSINSLVPVRPVQRSTLELWWLSGKCTAAHWHDHYYKWISGLSFCAFNGVCCRVSCLCFLSAVVCLVVSVSVVLFVVAQVAYCSCT